MDHVLEVAAFQVHVECCLGLEPLTGSPGKLLWLKARQRAVLYSSHLSETDQGVDRQVPLQPLVEKLRQLVLVTGGDVRPGTRVLLLVLAPQSAAEPGLYQGVLVEQLDQSHGGFVAVLVVGVLLRSIGQAGRLAKEIAHETPSGRAQGMDSHQGDAPDFWPVYVAFGPSQDKVNVWDFTRAVQFWTEGRTTCLARVVLGPPGRCRSFLRTQSRALMATTSASIWPRRVVHPGCIIKAGPVSMIWVRNGQMSACHSGRWFCKLSCSLPGPLQ